MEKLLVDISLIRERLWEDMLGSPVTIASDSRSSNIIEGFGFRVSWDSLFFSLLLLVLFFSSFCFPFFFRLVGCLEYVE